MRFVPGAMVDASMSHDALVAGTRVQVQPGPLPRTETMRALCPVCVSLPTSPTDSMPVGVPGPLFSTVMVQEA